MKRFLIGAAIASATLLPQAGQAAPVEYVRICETYGAGYFYIPGTDRCYNPENGKLRYYDEEAGREVVTETPFAARIRELEAQAAIANSLEDPDLVEGERFGFRVNWGATETANAVGVTGAILLGDNLSPSGGMRLMGTGGLGFSNGFVGARFGIQANF